MRDKEFAELESKLDVVLPEEYRKVFDERRSELLESGCFDGQLSSFYLAPEVVIDANLAARGAGSEIAEFFPAWWETFLLIGTNGAGDFYCLRLDQKPGVWMIGTDCGDEADQLFDTLNELIDLRLGEHREQLEKDRRRQELEGDAEAVELAAAESADHAKAKDWVTAGSPYASFEILDGLTRKVSPRKLRLYGLACCSLIENLDSDEDCARAIELAEQMVAGVACADEVAGLRSRMKERFLAICAGEEEYPFGNWKLGAARSLLQDDDDYLTDAPIMAGDADLLRVWNSAVSAPGEAEHQNLADLLREVLGNPFNPFDFDPSWRTATVVETAASIYEEKQFDRMTELAVALKEAGCEDERLLAHCRKKGGHVRGCWVLDLILENEPEPTDDEFTWDFKCSHPSIDSEQLKQRLQELGSAVKERPSEQDALAFADWLDEHGDRIWAEYVRIRCKLDGKSPGVDYADLVERRAELAASMRPGKFEFEGFYFSGYRFSEDGWWDDISDSWDRGFPSKLDAVRPGRGAGPVEQVKFSIQELISHTPVRGVNFKDGYTNELGDLLSIPMAQHLRWSEFENVRGDGQVGASIKGLAESAAAPSLERLTISGGIRTDEEAAALAQIPFDCLRRLDLPFGRVSCSATGISKLMDAPWFRNIEQLSVTLGEDCSEAAIRHLAEIPRLHSLALIKPTDQQIQAMGEAGRFPALRRLAFKNTDLTGGNCDRFRNFEAPELVELWLDGVQAEAEIIGSLVTAPMFANLAVLKLVGPRLDKEGLEALSQSPCAANLRVLRLRCSGDSKGSFLSLNGTALTRPGAFPALTTLCLENVVRSRRKGDVAKFFGQLAAPKLRHLTLNDFDFDDECAEILGESPAYKNLTRLSLGQNYDRKELLSSEAAKKFFASDNARNLVEISFENFKIAGAVELLAETSVMPRLGAGQFWQTGASREVRDQIKERRSEIHVGS